VYKTDKLSTINKPSPHKNNTYLKPPKVICSFVWNNKKEEHYSKILNFETSYIREREVDSQQYPPHALSKLGPRRHSCEIHFIYSLLIYCIMVQIVDYCPRSSKDGKDFYALVLQGGLSLVQSKQSGNYYATLKKCSIPSTFDEQTCKAMIGEKITGSIQKKSCESYEFPNKETGEIITLDYRWVYLPEGATLEEVIFEGNPEEEANSRRKPEAAVFLR
jgi:hypothetical protein